MSTHLFLQLASLLGFPCQLQCLRVDSLPKACHRLIPMVGDRFVDEVGNPPFLATEGQVWHASVQRVSLIQVCSVQACS